MSPALADLPLRKVVNALIRAGFVHARTKGSHAVYQHANGRVVVVPSTPRSSVERSLRSCGKLG
jgi:predicted RNA binding protein YcfA (HicA-like mRNA interferase family)